jgi:hypothetical protein
MRHFIQAKVQHHRHAESSLNQLLRHPLEFTWGYGTSTPQFHNLLQPSLRLSPFGLWSQVKAFKVLAHQPEGRQMALRTMQVRAAGPPLVWQLGRSVHVWPRRLPSDCGSSERSYCKPTPITLFNVGSISDIRSIVDDVVFRQPGMSSDLPPCCDHRICISGFLK